MSGIAHGDRADANTDAVLGDDEDGLTGRRPVENRDTIAAIVADQVVVDGDTRGIRVNRNAATDIAQETPAVGVAWRRLPGPAFNVFVTTNVFACAEVATATMNNAAIKAIRAVVFRFRMTEQTERATSTLLLGASCI